MTRRALSVTIALALLSATVSANDQPDVQDLKKLSLEELMLIDVTLVTRRPEPAGTAAAAIAVVTGDDIRRSGVTTIADAIALAGGLHVARFNNGTWAISARGFNANTANKLLVMVDGRTVYSPLFTGVFWNTLDYVLEDVERIEVVRGPGATLWGANAVNGVINVLTLSARDTQGGLLYGGAGDVHELAGGFRYGGRSGEKTYYRLSASYQQNDDFPLAPVAPMPLSSRRGTGRGIGGSGQRPQDRQDRRFGVGALGRVPRAGDRDHVIRADSSGEGRRVFVCDQTANGGIASDDPGGDVHEVAPPE